MARAATLAVVVAAVVLICSSSSAAATAEAGNARQQPPLAPGLSFDFYKRTCPKAESIVRSFVQDAVRKDVGLAAGLLRLHFHDCFVQGCDASVLLDGSATGPGEQQAPPNLTLRPTAFKAINDIHDRLQKECGGAVVSCSDVLALAARDSVVVSGGPSYKVPLGRRDSTSFATRQDVLNDLDGRRAGTPRRAVQDQPGREGPCRISSISMIHCLPLLQRLKIYEYPCLASLPEGGLPPSLVEMDIDRRCKDELLKELCRSLCENGHFLLYINKCEYLGGAML